MPFLFKPIDEILSTRSSIAQIQVVIQLSSIVVQPSLIGALENLIVVQLTLIIVLEDLIVV